MWWSLLSILAVVLVAAVTVFLFMYFFRPSVLVVLFFRLWRGVCGMQVKFIGDEEYIFCYGERGQKSDQRPSILFIHGFTSTKDQWNIFFRILPKEYHMIAVDMPGHGNSTMPPESQELTLQFAMECIKRFADLVKLTDRPFHLVGASLGGCLAGLFAAHFPHLVDRVTMICPAMKCPEESEFSLQVEQAIQLGADRIKLEHCRLLPQTPRELQLMTDSCIYAKTQFTKQVLKGVLELRYPKNSYFLRVFRALATHENIRLLESLCHRITMPSQLIWGAHDEIIHPSGAKLLQAKLPDCRDVTILERCGHSVDMDRPYAACSSIARFRGDTLPKKKAE